MSKAKKASAPIGAKTSWKNAFKRDWQLYLMLLFPLAMVIIFNYASYPGLRMIFMDYKPAKGYSGSEWVGMKTILNVFKDADFHRALKSSIAFNLLDLVVGFPMPIILALMLNELRYPRFKKVTQTILYLPHFLSWVIVGSVAYTMFRPTTGLVNIALMNWGVISEGIPFLTEKWHWAVTYLLIGVWQGMGWGTIIYLAAITGISGELYEAAMIDGANPIQIFSRIIFPILKPTTATVAILSFMWTWNDFNMPLVLLSDESQQTLQLAQYVFKSQFSVDYNLAFASYLLVLAPVLIVYIFCQKWIMNGVVAGAVK